MNALLNYGSSSSDSEEDNAEAEKSQTESTKPKLPKPTIGESSLQTSVFSNPFAEAELAKAAILEKHVKMKLKSVVCEGAGTMTAVPPPLAVLDTVLPTDDAIWEGATDKKKLKRPGLSQTLVPGKKVIKMYKEQKNKDTK